MVRAQSVHATPRNGVEDGQADEPAIGTPTPAEMRPKCLAKRPEEVSRREVCRGRVGGRAKVVNAKGPPEYLSVSLCRDAMAGLGD